MPKPTTYETIDLRVDKDTARLLSTLADLADVTIGQAASVIIALEYMRMEGAAPKARLTPRKEKLPAGRPF